MEGRGVREIYTAGKNGCFLYLRMSKLPGRVKRLSKATLSSS